MNALTRIDAEMMRFHSALSVTDECYFLWEYMAYGDHLYSVGNERIKNLKKPMDKKGTPEWKWKEHAIRAIATELTDVLPVLIDFAATTLVPIPPSKCRTNPLYDDRLLRVLRLACPADADIRELIINKTDLQPAHKSGEDYRPSVQAIFDNYALPAPEEAAIDPGDLTPKQAPLEPANPAPALPQPVRPTIALFDDVLTGGNHFTAAKRFLHQYYPDRPIIGIFICRRITDEIVP